MDNNENLIKAADVLPVLDDVVELLTEATDAVAQGEAKIAALERQLQDKDKVILEKVAAASQPRPPVFTDESIQETMQELQSLNIIDAEMAAKVASDIKSNPRAILPFLTKISAALITTLPESEGEGVGKEAAADGNQSDPDGWDAMAEGRPVKLVR